MLVKLAFAMQRLKKYLKIFCHEQQRWGRGNFWILWGDIELMGVPLVPPTRENPAHILHGHVWRGHEYVEHPNSLGRGDT